MRAPHFLRHPLVNDQGRRRKSLSPASQSVLLRIYGNGEGGFDRHGLLFFLGIPVRLALRLSQKFLYRLLYLSDKKKSGMVNLHGFLGLFLRRGVRREGRNGC